MKREFGENILTTKSNLENEQLKAKIMATVSELIEEANRQYDISQSSDNSPMVCGKATWMRNGIVYSIKKIVEKTGICSFEDLFENQKAGEI